MSNADTSRPFLRLMRRTSAPILSLICFLILVFPASSQVKRSTTTDPLAVTPPTAPVIAWIGDSWTSNDYITRPLRTYLQVRFGNGGPGYTPFGGASGPVAGTTYSSVGEWTPFPEDGVDLTGFTSVDVATPARKQIGATVESFTVHYLKQPGGGTFRYAVDMGLTTPWTIVDTSGTTLSYATLQTTFPNGFHTLALEVASAGTAGITVLGVDCRSGTNGAVVHRIGRVGATAGTFVRVGIAELWQTGIAALQPTTALLLFGTNEMALNVPPTTFANDLTALIKRVRAAVPDAEIVLAIPAENGLTDTEYRMADYASAASDVAQQLGIGFLNYYDAFGPYAQSSELGVWGNPTHVNSDGGEVLASMAITYLNARWGTAGRTRSDQTRQ